MNRATMRHAIARLGCLLVLAMGVGAPAHAQYVEYIHTDALGTPITMTDANRVVVERSEYEPYGKLLNRPLLDEPSYAGHVSDSTTGLSYMQQRYYDPQIGRFLSADPIKATDNGDGFNRYEYAESNPYRFKDPDGRAADIAGGSLTVLNEPPPDVDVQVSSNGGPRTSQEKGAVGERLSGIKPGDPKERIQSRTGTAKFRVADQSDDSTITEVKNVEALKKITGQMKDLVAEAKASLRDLVYKVRENTEIGKVVQDYFRGNNVRVERSLPRIENQPSLQELETAPDPMLPMETMQMEMPIDL